MNPFIKGKVDKIAITSILLVIFLVCVVMYPFYQSQKQNYLKTAFVEEELSLERIEFKIAFAKEQLTNAGSVIVDTLKLRAKVSYSDNSNDKGHRRHN